MRPALLLLAASKTGIAHKAAHLAKTFLSSCPACQALLWRPQLFLENNNGKGNWVGNKKKREKAFKDVGINMKTRERQRHVHTYLICPNGSALWLDKSPHRAGYVANHRYERASDSCSHTPLRDCGA